MFWAALTDFGESAFVHGSLAEMTDRVHLVVRGRVVDVRRGLFYPYEASPLEGSTPTPITVLLLAVAVDEILKGEPIMRPDETIEVRVYSSESEQFLTANLPHHEHVFFLMNDAQWRADLGFPPRDDDTERYTYVRPNGYQAVLRIIDGRVAAIRPERGNDPFAHDFPITLDGGEVADIVRRIRRAAGN